MMPSPSTALTSLLSRLRDWIPISEFETAMNDYFLGERPASEVADYRAKRGAVKKLRDEVTPVLHYIKFFREEGEIRFELGDGVPDCWLRRDAYAAPQGIEVTVAQSREQHYLGMELNEKGTGRGFLGLPDNAPAQAFSDKLASQRAMYTSDSALRVIGNGIKLCLEKKSNAKYADFDLIVEAPLRSLPNERWTGVKEELVSAALETPFRSVYVIGNQSSSPFGFRIK